MLGLFGSQSSSWIKCKLFGELALANCAEDHLFFCRQLLLQGSTSVFEVGFGQRFTVRLVGPSQVEQKKENKKGGKITNQTDENGRGSRWDFSHKALKTTDGKGSHRAHCDEGILCLAPGYEGFPKDNIDLRGTFADEISTTTHVKRQHRSTAKKSLSSRLHGLEYTVQRAQCVAHPIDLSFGLFFCSRLLLLLGPTAIVNCLRGSTQRKREVSWDFEDSVIFLT